MAEPTLPDRLETALDALFDLVETYGGERLEQQQAMWGAIENAIEDLAEASIDEGRRQATERLGRQWGARSEGGGVERRETEGAASRLAARFEGATVVSRLVGPWEPAEQLAVHLDNRDARYGPAEQPGTACGVPNCPDPQHAVEQPGGDRG